MAKELNHIDISSAERKIILSLIKKHLPNTTVWAYGSRATWSARPNSDLDLVAFASADQKNAVYDLKEAFEESDLPFRVDFFVWDQVPDEFRVNIERERVVLTGNRKSVLLKDFVTHKKGYAFKSSQYRPHGHPIVKVSNFEEDSISTQGLVFIDHEEVESHKSVMLHCGDVLIATVGSWPSNPASVVGRVVRVPHELDEALLNQNSVTLRAKPELDQNYLFYQLRSSDFKDYIIGTAQGSANQASIKLKDIFGYKFYIPPLKTQKAITHILGTIDDKIDLNRRMNETLEAMAQAIFKSCFVDFDGCTEFEDSELGRVPKGWKVGTLKDIATNFRKSVKPKELTESVPYFGLEHMPRNSIALSQWGDSEKITSNKYGFEAGDFLFGKLRPYFHKVGITPVDGICSTDILVIRPTEKVFYPLVMSIISSNHFVDYTTQLSNGAKMPRTNWKDMGKYEILIPDSDTCSKFKELINPLYKKIQTNIFQSRSLTDLRDTLLPKLISGELRVDEAEKMVGEA